MEPKLFSENTCFDEKLIVRKIFADGDVGTIQEMLKSITNTVGQRFVIELKSHLKKVTTEKLVRRFEINEEKKQAILTLASYESDDFKWGFTTKCPSEWIIKLFKCQCVIRTVKIRVKQFIFTGDNGKSLILYNALKENNHNIMNIGDATLLGNLSNSDGMKDFVTLMTGNKDLM